ncbi:MAG: hydantoinase/oxoprolinase family protein, partial [Chloroflexi bacterium]|nr:hydantoinase/oxoprolinase family protein [Chloroflexota bacterium]
MSTGFAWLVGVDVGGTFTDLVAVDAVSGAAIHLKVPTTPSDPSRGFVAALAELERQAPTAFGGGQMLLLHGTTLATNAILERKLAKTGLVTTKGFRDVLEIGRHWRADLYDLDLRQPAPLVPRPMRLELPERIAPNGEVELPLDETAVEAVTAELREQRADAIAVILLNSYRNPLHERRVRDLLLYSSRPSTVGDSRAGWYVCASVDLNPEVREYERTSTTVLNAALMPLIDRYLEALERELERWQPAPKLFVMQSSGGAATTATARSRPVSLALSGPVAGVNACVHLAALCQMPNLIGFDVGGTSADVAVVEAGRARVTPEMAVGDYPIRLPMVKVNTIGAGGGSLAWVDRGGSLRVGPESAGADPGPACYARGGERATVTDAHLVLGRLDPAYFLGGKYRLEPELAREAVRRHVAEPLGLTLDEAAHGIIRVVDANMERAIKVSLAEQGNDPRDFALVSFGGAGGLHAASLARQLEIPRVLVPRHPGTLSAFGLLVGDVRHDFAASELLRSNGSRTAERVDAIYTALEAEARQRLEADGFAVTDANLRRTCEARYVGQAYEVNVEVPGGRLDEPGIAALVQRFHGEHHRLYAHSNPGEPVDLVTYRMTATGELQKPRLAPRPTASGGPTPSSRRPVYFEDAGYVDCAIYRREGLVPGHELTGPAIVE